MTKFLKWIYKILFVNILSVCLVSSCTDLSGIEADIDNLYDRIGLLEDAVSALQTAYDEGKTIKSVDAITLDGIEGWLVTFSDNSTIQIVNGRNGADGANGKDGKDGEDGIDGIDGVTPILQVDAEGYWTVSYDGGSNYTRIFDSAGKPIPARGEKGESGKDGENGEDGKDGEDGEDGKDGKDGEDGKDGAEGLSIRVVIGANGCYVIESYYSSAPDTIINSIETSFTSNTDSILSSIVKNSETGVITLTMADGSTFCFNLDITYPTGIVLLSNELMLCKGSTNSFEFRVNPSNARVNFGTEDSEIALDLVNENITRSSYITPPVNYKLSRVEASKDDDGNIKTGQYTAYIQDLGTAEEYSEGAMLVISSKDGNGNDIQISSPMINIYWEESSNKLTDFSLGEYPGTVKGNNIVVRVPYNTDVTGLKASFKYSGSKVYVGDVEQKSGASRNDFSSPVLYRVVPVIGEEQTYLVSIAYSNLPVVYIKTPESAAVTSKENWVEESTMIITNTDNSDHAITYEKMNIRGRGNSTWAYPKKPYAIKLDKKAEVLGMPKHKRWVLLANWMDRTCMRNAVAFEIARRTADLAWTPRGEFVEVVLNGKLLGNYYLCEQIKIDENRVNITEISPDDTEGDAVTGGYLLELDTYFDEAYKFKTELLQLPVNLKGPDEDVPEEQLKYIENYFNSIESSLYADDFPTNSSYQDYLDINSFIDWWFVYELTQNGEPNHPKSSYMHKDRNGKLLAGPVWDFDWGTFKPNSNSFYIKDAIWYSRLFLDPEFVSVVKTKWAASKSAFEDVLEFIDETTLEIKASAEANCAQWPISGTANGDESLSFEEAAARLRSAYSQRLTWMDNAINEL